MRGDTNKTPESEALILPLVKKVKVTAAYLVDENNRVIYHLISAWWVNLLIIGSVLMILAITMVSGLTLYNGQRVDTILLTPTVKEEIKTNEQSK